MEAVMTREHKLALVLGFGLLLFVGILVSDHFSAAQLRDNANLAARNIERDRRPSQNFSLQSLDGTGASRVVDLGGAGGTPGVRPVPALDVAPAGILGYEIVGADPLLPVQPAAIPTEAHVIISGESLYKICSVKYGDGSLWTKLAEFNNLSERDAKRLRAGSKINLPSEAQLRGGDLAVYPGLVAPVGNGVDHDGFPIEAQGMAAGDVASTTESYTIRAGDTLSTIAARKLGTKNRWREIQELNRSTLRDPAKLKVGTVIQLPPQ